MAQGRIPDEDIEQLRERSDIVDIIGGQTQLRKAGRIFKGLCPFHQEKTPSFTVDPTKNLFHCFGCGVGGDVFTFMERTEGLTFTEAAQRLADRVGMTLRFEGKDPAATGMRRRILEVNKVAATEFSELLMGSSEATGARKHLEERGFNSEDAKTWGIGYSPAGRDTLYRKLLERKFSGKEIVEAGLALVTESGEHRDRFRGRVMFPIWDVSGQVVGFGARALGDEMPKYLNSPETSIYRKSKLLYGLDKAKAEMVRGGFAVVTEGYTDVIALHKVGVTNSVATCGTALGEDHFALIKRFCDRVILAFDADAAGKLAAERGFGIDARYGLEVLVAPIPAGKDPADVALTEGAETVRLILEDARPLIRFVLEAELSRVRLDTADAKGKAVRAAAEILSQETNRVARGEHAFWVARRIGVEADLVQRELSELAQSTGRNPQVAQTIRVPGHVKVEREALAILIDSPSYLEQASEWLNESHFTQPQHKVLFRALMEGASREGDSGSIMTRLPDEESRRMAAEIALSPILTKDPEEVFLRLEEFRINRQIKQVRETLDRLDPQADSKRYDELFQHLMNLEAERRKFDER
ncbi:MAG: DNA primase [Actinobacteria bacterium]|nr:DNA primase [Actinomycetota bacterium]